VPAGRLTAGPAAGTYLCHSHQPDPQPGTTQTAAAAREKKQNQMICGQPLTQVPKL